MLFHTRDGHERGHKEHPRQCILSHQVRRTISGRTLYTTVPKTRAHTKILGTIAIVLQMLSVHTSNLTLTDMAFVQTASISKSQVIESHRMRGEAMRQIGAVVGGLPLCGQSTLAARPETTVPRR